MTFLGHSCYLQSHLSQESATQYEGMGTPPTQSQRGGCPAPRTGTCTPTKDLIHNVQEARWVLISLPVRNDARTIQPIAHHYTDYTIPAARNVSDKLQLLSYCFSSTTHPLAQAATSANALT